MSGRTALVVGPTGAIGSALVAAMEREGEDPGGGWSIFGMSRSAPAGQGAFAHLAADLLDPEEIRRALAAAPPVTHVFYSARAPHGEGGVEDVSANVAMLVHIVEAAEARSNALAHVHLVEGTKWYGVHLGPHRTPAQEDDPRHLPPNFYYDQQDALEALQQSRSWTWSACRSNVVCDFAPERARNLTTVIAAYGAICRELGVPMDFPGTQAGYDTLTEVTDAAHLADAILWMSTRPNCVNRAFNVTNGDGFRWRYLWPRLAAFLGVACGEPRDIRLAEWMADKGQVWARVVARHGLVPRPLESLSLWAFGDFVFRQDWDVLTSMTRIRQTGYYAIVDSASMFETQITKYRAAGILPGAN